MEEISQFSLRSFLWFSFPLALTLLFLLFISGDLLVFKKGGRLKILDLASRELPPASIAQLATIISQLSPSNYYFWPDRPMDNATSPK